MCLSYVAFLVLVRSSTSFVRPDLFTALTRLPPHGSNWLRTASPTRVHTSKCFAPSIAHPITSRRAAETAVRKTIETSATAVADKHTLS